MKSKAACPAPWDLQKHGLDSQQSLIPYLHVIYTPLANLGFKPSIFKGLSDKLISTVPDSVGDLFSKQAVLPSSSSSSSSSPDSAELPWTAMI